MTVFPNLFQHEMQNEASMEVHRWWPLVERKCSPDIAFFLCSLYAPVCTILDRPILPCRELCLRVQRGCLPAIEYLYSSRWPDNLQCERFPRRSEEVCIDRPQNTSQITVTPSGPAKGEVASYGAVYKACVDSHCSVLDGESENSSLSQFNVCVCREFSFDIPNYRRIVQR